MGTANGKPLPRYSVGVTGSADAELQAIGKAASIKGVGPVIELAYQTIRARLRTDPDEFGGPLYHIPKMKMTIRCAAVAPLYVEYGLHDDAPVVVIRRIAALDATP